MNVKFTKPVKEILHTARNYAFTKERSQIDCESLIAASVYHSEGCIRLAECLTNGDLKQLKTAYPETIQLLTCKLDLEYSKEVHQIIEFSQELAYREGLGSAKKPGAVDLPHLICAIACSQQACFCVGNVSPLFKDEAPRFIKNWNRLAQKAMSIPQLVETCRGLQAELLERVYGQDHAVHAFVEGMYNSQVTAEADLERTRPSAIFVFAGPPGVGKTYLSTLGAEYLKRPFKRFDMTAYSDHQDHNQLVGFAKSYVGAKEGHLTGFVRKHPNAILLFDEIEKAHLNTVQLFYQVLDAGTLEDKFLESKAAFRDTIIIFTTNAGKSLYDNPNKSGISTASSNYHKRTILNALENEKNPTTRRPVFPQAICSRLGQGYPLMFNHLGISDLERITATEMRLTESLLERQHLKTITHSPLVPLTILLREGGRVDARQLRSEAEKFVKNEVFKFSKAYPPDKLKEVFQQFNRIRFEVEGDALEKHPEIKSLFLTEGRPRVILTAGEDFSRFCETHIPEVDWIIASSASEIIDCLATEDIDFVLLDLWIKVDIPNKENTSKEPATQPEENEPDPTREKPTAGKEILRKIHERSPHTSVYLLAFVEEEKENAVDSDSFSSTRYAVDDELFLACIGSGGARGLVTTSFLDSKENNFTEKREEFLNKLKDIHKIQHREQSALNLASERRVLNFETKASLRPNYRKLNITLGNFSLKRSIDAEDAGELVEDIERPSTKFQDVFGATAAKEELEFIVEWLKNPKYFKASGVRAPKGILLTGPPGTGKTMLARALAGESNCAFMESSASSFVTIYQGSGPQNVRDLFKRARRYAPSVIFIDEIDAIGLKRQGMGGGGRAEEATLNTILTEMDGFRSGKDAPVIVLAATNLADRLDPALKRRFDSSIEVDKPAKEDRLSYLKKVVLGRRQSKVTLPALETIARQSTGMTIADLERVVHAAAKKASRANKPISDPILEDAFETERMGVAKEKSDPETIERVARHEAGHAVIAWLGGNPPLQVTIVGRGNAGGYMERELDENKLVHTRHELEQLIREAMGGRAAELIYYGKYEGLSTGAGGDLQSATRIAVNMVCSYGMDAEFGLASLDSERGLQGPLAEKITQSAAKIVQTQLGQSIKILTENRKYLDTVSDMLVEKNRLTREDLKKIFL